jgi:hypothetical protein
MNSLNDSGLDYDGTGNGEVALSRSTRRGDLDGQMNSGYRRSEVDVSGCAGVRRGRAREERTRELPETQAMPETTTSL